MPRKEDPRRRATRRNGTRRESKLKLSKPTRKPLCFTIMPFSENFNSYYTEIYIPAIKSVGLEPCRADDLYRPSSIVTDIWNYTRRAKLILADLTGKNPNVFYELGLAHSLGKPVVMLAESMDDVPFDLRPLRVILYDKNHHAWGEALKTRIQQSIREVMRAPSSAVLQPFMREARKPATSVRTVSRNGVEAQAETDGQAREIAAQREETVGKRSRKSR